MDEETAQNILKELKDIKKQNEEIKKPIDDANAQFDSLNQRVRKVEEEMALNTITIKELDDVTDSLCDRMNEHKQYSRRDNLVINGIPKMERENLKEIVQTIGVELKVDVQNHDIAVVHRLLGKTEAPPIIVRLNNREIKTRLIKEARVQKLIGKCLGLDPSTPIY